MSTSDHDYAELLQRSLSALDDLEAELQASEARRHEPIAIVGMGLRFPGGANDPEGFWDLLVKGTDAVTEIPAQRWDLAAMYDPDPEAAGKSYTRWGAFVEGVDQFDAGFFGISPREAVSMDPQQRLALEVAWEALEHAGIAPAQLAGSATGVYLGIIGTEYADLALQNGVMEDVDAYFASGVSQSIAAGRLAYALDLRGPAVAVDTACSSSLVATHLACQALRSGDCTTAMAGGVSVMLSPDAHILTSRAKMMSFEGRCKTFDAGADGYVRGEGCAFVVLERLSDAQARGRRILGVIRGTASNQDGRSNGLTAPSAAAQEAVIRGALEDGGVEPNEVGFVECHGTGTTLGDPIEIRALQAVFGGGRPPERPLRVQSVKTNIGHLEAAAGVAGLCKLVLALEHGELPVHLHLNEPNPYIPWREIAVVAEPGPARWDEPAGAARIGGLSSFGFSGTNVHLVVAQAPPAVPPSAEDHPGDDAGDLTGRTHRVYTVSARTSAAVEHSARRHAAALSGDGAATLDWRAAAATVNTGRAHLDERIAVVASTAQEAADRLRAAADGDATADAVRGRAAPTDDGVLMLFTGQGSQFAGMGSGLYQAEPVFRGVIDECADVLAELSGFDLRASMFTASPDSSSINDTRSAQPALFAFEVATAALWKSWGVVPAAVLGHSIGELAAAHVAGVLSLHDALAVVDARGRLMQALPRDGGMVAVLADADTVAAALAPFGEALAIAAFNGPRNVVVSGRLDALDALVTHFETGGVRVTRLDVSHAFHSPLMEPMLDEFEHVLSTVELRDPAIELISNRTAAGVEPGVLTTARYWRDHARHAVRFADSIQHALDSGYRTMLEVGPAPTLTAMARSIEAPRGTLFVASSRRGTAEAVEIQRALACLHVAGIGVDWSAYESPSGPPVSLPTYPFEHERYWHPLVQPDRRGRPAPLSSAAADHGLLGRRLSSPHLTGQVFERELSPSSPGWLADHVVYGTPIVPAAAYLELMGMAGDLALGTGHDVVGLRIDEPLLLEEGRPAVVQTIVEQGTGTDQSADPTVEVHSQTPDGWRRHATARLASPEPVAPSSDLSEAVLRCSQPIDGDEYYGALEGMGVHYGGPFRLIESAHRRTGEVVATLRTPAGARDGTRIHPGLVDSCLQVLGLALPGADDLAAASGDVYLPVEVDRWHVSVAPEAAIAPSAAGVLTAHGRLRDDPSVAEAAETDAADTDAAETVRDAAGTVRDVVVGDLELFDSSGRLVAAVGGVRFKRTTRAAMRALPGTPRDWYYVPTWVAAPLPDEASAGTASPGSWVVVGATEAARPLQDALHGRGASVELLVPGAVATPADIGARLADLLTSPRAGVVLLLPLGGPTPGHEPAVAAAISSTLAAHPAGPSLTVVTARAMTVVPGDRGEGAAQASVWGVGRVATTERPHLFCRLVDMNEADDAPTVVDELLADDHGEPQVAWRDGVRYALRLARPAELDRLPLPDGPYLLSVAERGRLDGLQLVADPGREPGPGEVCIEVRATGLNFRDVLNVMGRYAGEASTLGGECAGIVRAVGARVSRVRAGDRVMAVADASFATTCVVAEEMVTRLPGTWSDAEAASVPIAFLTADYALNVLGRLGAGERVLIHSATGGVGMAALQLAQRAGAEIFATAGSPAKRAALRALGIGHVYDSRRVDFRDEILADTAGAGVDVVLNSLTGEAIAASVDVLSPDGRFLEIGLAGIWDDDAFRAARPDAEYHVLYLGQVCVDEPAAIAARFDALVTEFERGQLRPLPITAFDVRNSVTAFRLMAQARHIGKVVVTAAPGRDMSGTWIVTGGVGGLGLAVAAELAEAGATRLVLCSRHAPPPESAVLLEDLTGRCPDVRVVELDVTDAEAVSTMVSKVTADGERLRGVVHAAGVLDDAMLRDLDVERFDTVMAPKVVGAHNLLRAIDPHRPDHVVLLSAGAVLFGAAGQGNYAAANAALDALAHQRRSAGLPAQAVNWGPWSGVGMAARLGEAALRRWEAQGVVAFDPTEGREAFRTCTAGGEPQIAALNLRWPALVHHFSKHGVPPIMRDLVRDEHRRHVDSSADPSTDLVQDLLAVAVERRKDALEDRVKTQVLRVLGLSVNHPIEPLQGLTDVGMDSLMAVELSNRLSVLVDRTLPSTLAFEQPTLRDLTGFLQELLESQVDFVRATDDAPAADDALAELTSDELTAALMHELEQSGY